MKSEVECPRCGSSMVYVYKRIDENMTLVRVSCDNSKCNYEVTFTTPL